MKEKENLAGQKAAPGANSQQGGRDVKPFPAGTCSPCSHGGEAQDISEWKLR